MGFFVVKRIKSRQNSNGKEAIDLMVRYSNIQSIIKLEFKICFFFVGKFGKKQGSSQNVGISFYYCLFKTNR